MKKTLLLYFFFFVIGDAKSQTKANLKNVIKSEADAKQSQKNIDELAEILTTRFLAKANSKNDKINKQIQTYFYDYKNSQNGEQYIYPTILKKINLSSLVLNQDVSWGLIPNAKDSTLLDGFGNSTLDAIISIPIMDRFNKGYSMNTISFNCKLTQNVSYSEKYNNELPIEKLPSYKKKIILEIKMVDFLK